MADIRNIGIFAHVDAGKTSLSERLLQHAGMIRTAGAVDSGTAHTDRLEIERRRGISVKAAFAPVDWKGTRIQMIDTPGHADFASEVERSIWAIDGAVIVISAPEGVQSQTEVVFSALKRAKIPTIFFFNKTDRPGADIHAALQQVRQRLTSGAFLLADDEDAMAALADFSEEAMLDFLQGTIWNRERLTDELKQQTAHGEMSPVLCGSALQDRGIDELLDAILTFLPAPTITPSVEPSGIVFALDHDPVMGIGAHVRLYTGSLINRQTIRFPIRKDTGYGDQVTVQERKITQIRELTVDGRGRDTGVLNAGQIGCLYGLTSIRVGTVIGDASLIPRDVNAGEFKEPLMMVKVLPLHAQEQTALHTALEVLTAQDPLLDVRQYRGIEHIRVMGAIQLQILQEMILRRFGLSVSFGPPQVIYRQTIRKPAVGFVAYLAPKPCWAVIRFELEPLPRGSGIQYQSITPVRRIKERYQHQIEQALPMALSQGMLGWMVDDIRITLTDGEDHQFHTHPLDFIVATPMALMDGLRRAGSQLLEPIVEMKITADEALTGKLMTQINTMRGETTNTASHAGQVTLTALVPVASSVDFPVRLQILTSGRYQLSMRLHSYRDVQLKPDMICERRGVNPLDTAKYILAARNALDGNIF